MSKGQLQERDRRLLKAAEQLKYLTRENASVIGPFGSRSRANARLLSLVRAGFLKRAYLPVGTTRRSLYMLNDRKRSDARSMLFVEHELAVNDVLIAATHGATNVKVVSWQKEAEVAGLSNLIPDACIQVARQDGQRFMVCLEVDRGSESGSKWVGKVQKYRDAAALMALRTSNPSILRCAVVCLSERRLDGLRRYTSRLTNKGFRFATLDAIRTIGFWSYTWSRVEGDERVAVI